MGKNGNTAVVSINSELVRKDWMMEGLVQAQSKSFTAAYTGNSFESIVYQETNISASKGHTVVFDFDGNLVGKAVKNKETATGTGEVKKKFSDLLTVDRYRFVVDNGDKFDGVNIGDLSITEHTDSRNKLADLWVRVKDQAILDVAQQSATHRIDLGSTFTFDQFLDIENIVKTGEGYKSMTDIRNDADKRLPLKPFYTADGNPVWLFVVDSSMKTMLMKSTGASSIFAGADVRGNENRLIKGVLGRIGNFLIVEAGNFFGETKDTVATGDFVDATGYAQLNKTEIQMSGLRQFYGANLTKAPSLWTGEKIANQPGNNKRFSRGLILGAGAIQFAMGKAPDYKFEESPDFKITSESCMEVWCGVKATKLFAENSDYNTKIGGISHGIVAVDVQLN